MKIITIIKMNLIMILNYFHLLRFISLLNLNKLYFKEIFIIMSINFSKGTYNLILLLYFINLLFLIFEGVNNFQKFQKNKLYQVSLYLMIINYENYYFIGIFVIIRVIFLFGFLQKLYYYYFQNYFHRIIHLIIQYFHLLLLNFFKLASFFIFFYFRFFVLILIFYYFLKFKKLILFNFLLKNLNYFSNYYSYIFISSL